MNELLESIFRADATGRYANVLAHLRVTAGSYNVPYEVYQLLNQHRFLEAHVVAKLFRGVGLNNPLISLARAVGGFLFGDPGDEAEGVAALSAQIDLLGEEQRQIFWKEVLHKVIAEVVTSDASVIHGGFGRLLRLIEIYRAGSLEFRSIFDWSATAELPSLDELRSAGRARAQLIDFQSPPAGTPRQPRRAIVAIRRTVFPQMSNSRLYDIGPRVVAAMDNYGWQATHLETALNPNVDFMAMVAACEAARPDMLFIDDYVVMSPDVIAPRAAMLARLHAVLPDMKIVAVHLDPWAIENLLMAAADGVDGIWAPFPAAPFWRHPIFSDKKMLMPYPFGGKGGPPVTPVNPIMTFSGASFGYNWPRAFWLAGVERGMPYHTQLSTHSDDGMEILDSFGEYMTRLEASGAALNFTVRADLSRICPGRVFEAIVAGALLVSEEADDIDRYFVAGEHYLSFRTAPELRAISRLIAEQPEEVEKIRRAGSDFAQAHYSDDKIIGYIDSFLYHRT